MLAHGLFRSPAQFAGATLAQVEEQGEGRSRVDSKRITPLGEFHYIKSSLTALYLRDKGLRVTQALGQNGLRAPGLMAQLCQQVQESTVVPMVS
jgi:hypothetical protein